MACEIFRPAAIKIAIAVIALLTAIALLSNYYLW